MSGKRVATIVSRPADEALIDLAERASEFGPDREHLQAALRKRADDVVSSLEALIGQNPELAVRLAAALPAFWEDLGRVDEGRRLTGRAIEAAGEDATSLAGAHLAASELAFRQGDQDEAAREAGIALDRALAAGDRRVAALVHVNLARIAYRNGDAATIDRHARAALEVAPDDPGAQRGALHMLAWAAHTVGDVALARDRFEASVALRTEMGDSFGVAVEIANLGDLAAEQGDLATAATHLGHALEIAVQRDNQYLLLNLLPSLAVLAAVTGDDEAAALLVGAADGVGERSGLVPDPGAWQPALDEVERRLGERSADLRQIGRAMPTRDAVARAGAVAQMLAQSGGQSAENPRRERVEAARD